MATYVFADSVLCLGGVKENQNEAWKDKIKWYFESDHLKDLNRIDGEPMEFGWKILQGFTTFGFLEQIQKIVEERQGEPEQFEGRIIFMTMFNDIVWEKKKMQRNVKIILVHLRIMLADFRAVIGHSWDLDQKRNGTELALINLMEFGTKLLKT